MKALVVYYSLSGATKKAAESISQILKCDIEEILDMKNRKGPLGFLSGGRDAMKKQLTQIATIKKNPANYDLLIVGTPTWAGFMAPAVRTYLSENKNSLKKIAVFSTHGGDNAGNVFPDLESFIGKAPIATLDLQTKGTMSANSQEKIAKFCKSL